MINKKSIYLKILLMCLVCLAWSQTDAKNGYAVVCFEYTQGKKAQSKTYYWIMPIETIENKSIINIFPLFTEEYAFDSYLKCLKGDSVDIFPATSATNYNFDSGHIKELNNFLTIVEHNKKLIQSLVINWNIKTRSCEKVNIYVAAIMGELCNCVQKTKVQGDADLNYISRVYMPVSSFVLIEDFWSTKTGQFIRHSDFSSIDFSSHIPQDFEFRKAPRIRSSLRFPSAN